MINLKNKIGVIVLIFSVLLLFNLVISNNSVYASTSTSMTIVDTVGGAETKFNPNTTERKEGKGWVWTASDKTLTLSEFDGERIEANGDFTLKLIGKSTMHLSGQGAKGLCTHYNDGTITIENSGYFGALDSLTFDCTNVNGDHIISACKVVHNSGKIYLNCNQTEDGLGRVYGPYCNSGYNMYNKASLEINMNSNYASSTLEGTATIDCHGENTVKVTVNGISNSCGIGGLYIEEGSTAKVTVDVQDSNPDPGYATYAIEGLYRIGSTGTLTVKHGRVLSGWSYSSYPDISSKIKITPSNKSKNYIIFPISISGYRAPTFIDATTKEPIEDGITFTPQKNEVALSAVTTDILDLKEGKVDETAVTTYQKLFTYYIAGIVHGLNPKVSNEYATYEVISGAFPEGVGVSPTYGFVTGIYEKECQAGSVTIKVTRKSDNSTANVTINYGKVLEADKKITIDAGTATETVLDITSDGSGNGWSYVGGTNTLTLDGYTGGPIYSDKGLDITLRNTNTINVKKGDKGGIIADYFGTAGVLTIIGIGGNANLTINVDSNCDTISDSIINANKFNLYSGKLNINCHLNNGRINGIYCNSGTYVESDESFLTVDLSTKDDYIEAVNSLYVNNHEGTINVSVQSDYNGDIIAVGYLKVNGGNTNITLSAKTNSEFCQNYATEDIAFNAEKGKIVVNDGIVATAYNYSSSFRCTNKTKITTKNSNKNWILNPCKGYLNNAYIFVDSNSLEIIKDGLTIEAKSSILPLKFKTSKAFNISKSKVGDKLKSDDGLEVIVLRGGLEGIDYYNEDMNFKVVEGKLPKGITLNNGGSLYGTFEEITQPDKVKIRATRLADNSFVEFYINIDKVISDDPDLVFPDVPNGKWYTQYVKYVKDHGLMSGYTSGSYKGEFGPDDLIKRGQIAVMLYRLEGSPYGEDDPETTLVSKFPDVQDKSKYYYKAAVWANDNGIITGYTSGDNKGKFGPNDYIKRQDLAVMLARYAKYKGKNINSSFSLDKFIDKNDISSYAKDSLKYIVEKEIITGNDKLGKDKLRILPKDNAKRSETAKMITCFCQKVLGM